MTKRTMSKLWRSEVPWPGFLFMPYNPIISSSAVFLKQKVRLNKNMCIFNVFKMYSVTLLFCKVNTTYLKLRLFSSGSSVFLPYS